jgi:hypothetical protein
VKRVATLVAGLAVTGALFGAAPAHASYVKVHNCEGHVDYACNDGGALCTIWLDFSCLLGVS